MLLDNFNRANENPLSGNGQWGSWGAFPSDPLAVVSNQAVGSTAGGCSSRWMTNLGADVGISARYVSSVGNVTVNMWLALRDADLSTYDGYSMSLVDSEGRNISISLIFDGVVVDGVNSGDAFPLVATGDVISFSRYGNELAVGINGVTVFSWTDAVLSAAGQVAIGVGSTSDALDDFSADISDANRAPVIYGRGAA